MTVWDPDVARRLDAWLARATPSTRAAFDADGTLWREDVGESFLQWAGERQGRLPAWPEAGSAWREYERRLATGDLRHAFEHCVTAFEGLDHGTVVEWSDRFVATSWERHLFPAMRELVGRLKSIGAEAWIVSGSPAWCVAAGARLLEIGPERVLAAEAKVEGGRIAADLAAPLPTLETKVEAFRSAVGSAPHFAAGNSHYDYDLLESSTELALLVNPPPGEGWLRRRNGRDWLVQRW